MHRNAGFEHLHKRKQIHLKKDKYPSPNKWIRLLDFLIYFVAIMGPVITIPQVIKILAEHNASGVSLFSWAGYTVAAGMWIVYGIVHKEKPIILANSAGLLMNILVLAGIIVYG